MSERIFRRNPADVKKCPHCNGKIDERKCRQFTGNDSHTKGCIVRQPHRHIRCKRTKCRRFTTIVKYARALR